MPTVVKKKNIFLVRSRYVARIRFRVRHSIVLDEVKLFNPILCDGFIF